MIPFEKNEDRWCHGLGQAAVKLLFSKRLTLCKFACIETTDRCGFVLQIFNSENLLTSGCGVLVR